MQSQCEVIATRYNYLSVSGESYSVYFIIHNTANECHVTLVIFIK